MVMKVYHGTTWENYQNIQLRGFDNSKETVWDCSIHSETYVWVPSQLMEHGEAEDMEEATERAIQMAFESAQISAALLGSLASEIVVIELNVNPDDLEVDESCENMGHASCIANKKIDIFSITGIYTAPYYADLRLFILNGFRDNQWIKMWMLPEITYKALEMMPRDIFMEELLEFEYEYLECIDRTEHYEGAKS
jgi:hypothetical protein